MIGKEFTLPSGSKIRVLRERHHGEFECVYVKNAFKPPLGFAAYRFASFDAEWLTKFATQNRKEFS